MKWIDANKIRPPCPRGPDTPGTPVLIWPRAGSYGNDSLQALQYGLDGWAYYGRRATGSPAFYLFGGEIPGVTHWMPMPKGPAVTR